MCPCYKDYFKEEAHPYIKHVTHFYCKCEQYHDHFVHFCSYHPFGSNMYAVTEDKGEFQKNCFCHKEHVNSICQYCISIRYSLNFLSHKICVQDHKAVPLHDYLEKIPCEPFLFLITIDFLFIWTILRFMSLKKLTVDRFSSDLEQKKDEKKKRIPGKQICA